MNLGVSEHLQPLLNRIRVFCDDHIAPLDQEYLDEVSKGDRWVFTERQTMIIETLKERAKSQGLWNFFLTNSTAGPGLTNVDYAYLAEIMGRYHIAAEVFNCNAPDTGNMEVLHKYGSDEQKAQWLAPLLDGSIRSAFAMTEPDLASSDATNISCTARLDGDDWVIDGEKFYISGAGDPRCKIMIVMVKTNDNASRHRQHSQILVPMDASGVEIIRPMNVFSMDDAPHGHMHLRFTQVRVPKENIILGEGCGFEISQGRLGPGRIHHCMRALGVAEKALALMCDRATKRTAFGKPLFKLGGNLDVIANARMSIEQGRLLTLKAAWMMDTASMVEAREYISQIKVVVPNLTQKIIDDAIQIYGASGISQDTPLASMYMMNRILRLADGPDEVHRMVVGRAEMKKYL